MRHGQLLHDVLGWQGPQTGRQLAAWEQWDRDQWNEPDRTDHYLMRIALEVARVLSSKPNDFKLEKFKIPFKWEQSEAAKRATETPEERKRREDLELRWLKATWSYRLGRVPDPKEAMAPDYEPGTVLDGGDLDGGG